MSTTTNGKAVATVEPTEGSAISAFASEGNFVSAQRMAKGLQASSLVPKEYRENISNVLIAMELSSRIGCSVLMVMQNLHVIQGRPSWSSSFLIASVNASGRFSPLRFRWEGEEGSDGWGCRAVATDRETGEECVGSLVTLKLAKDEGWFGKSGSKWKTMPEQMCMYRSAAFWARVFCPEIAMGIRPADEIEDMGFATPAPSAAAEEMEAVLRAAADTAEPKVIVGEVIEDDEPSGPATKAQLNGLRSLLDRARDADVMSADLEELVQAAVESEDQAEVVGATRTLSLAIATAAGEQASLLGEE